MSKTAKNHLTGDDFTLLSNVELKFGYREGPRKVETLEFLENSKCVVGIIEKMGKVFAPLKYDMNGNITKITNKYASNECMHEYLEDMILAEKTEGGTATTDALQWLRRGLHFIARLFECIVNDAEAGYNQQNLKPFFKVAYEEVLKRYHGWTGSQLFNIMCRFAPNRKELFQILSVGETYKEEVVLQDIQVFKTNLLVCVQHLITFYKIHNLEDEAQV